MNSHTNPAYNHDQNDATTSTDDVTVEVKKQESSTEIQVGDDERYGCFCKPGCLQPLNKMVVFVVCTVIMCFVEGYAVNGVANATRPHIEKQFGLTSSSGQRPSGICDLSNSSSSGGGGGSEDEEESSLSHYLGVFMVANILHGMGFCPMFTVGTVYIDENEKPSLAAVYIGMTYAAAAIGVALGFFVGGQFTEKLYVDFDTIDQDSPGFGPRDSRWVGAWWTGFVPSVFLFIIIAIPIFGFPRQLPGRPTSEKEVKTVEDDKLDSKDQPVGDASGTSTIQEGVLQFFSDIAHLLLNPAFLFLSLGGATEALIISGVGAFSFKFLAEQYDMSFDTAGNLLGGLILFSALGMVTGGILIKCLKLEAGGMAKLNAMMALGAGLLGLSVLANCPDVRLAGLEVSYPGESSVQGWASPCQGPCHCQDMDYNPVCGTDNRVYYSPCHAGCVVIVDPGPSESYSNCSCLAVHHNVSNMSSLTTATLGRCDTSCWGLCLVAPLLFIMLFAVLITTTPTSMATLRIVPPRLKSFGLGLQWILLRLLGMIPGPPLVGWVLDETCLIWTKAPDGTAFCALYNMSDMAVGITVWWVVVSAVAAVFFFIAGMCLTRGKPPPLEEAGDDMQKK